MFSVGSNWCVMLLLCIARCFRPLQGWCIYLNRTRTWKEKLMLYMWLLISPEAQPTLKCQHCKRAMPRDKTRNTPITLPGFVVSCAHGVDGLLRRKPIECVHCRYGIVNQPPQPNISAILHPVSLPPSLYFSRFLALRAWSLSIWKQRTITILKSISVLVGIAINWFVWDNALYRRQGRPPRSHLFISAVRTE